RGVQLPARARHGDGPATGLRDGELGAWLRRLPPASRPRDAAPQPVARGVGTRPLRRRLGRWVAGRRLAAAGAEGAGRAGAGARARADGRLGARVLPPEGELRGGPRGPLPEPD